MKKRVCAVLMMILALAMLGGCLPTTQKSTLQESKAERYLAEKEHNVKGIPPVTIKGDGNTVTVPEGNTQETSKDELNNTAGITGFFMQKSAFELLIYAIGLAALIAVIYFAGKWIAGKWNATAIGAATNAKLDELDKKLASKIGLIKVQRGGITDPEKLNELSQQIEMLEAERDALYT